MGFLNSLNTTRGTANLDFRIVMAASNYEDFRFFNKLRPLMPCSALIDIVCVENYLVDSLRYLQLADRYRNNTDRCIVNLKKMIAISWAIENGHEWIACIDCDVASMANPSNLFPHLIRNYESGLYFGQSSSEDTIYRQITTDCRTLFPATDQQRLSQITLDDRCYAWFFDVPLYNAADYTAFMSDVTRDSDSVEAWLCRINYFSFEHLIFLLWRCLHKNARLIDLAEMQIHEISEYLKFHDLARIKAKYGYEPAWAPYVEVLHHPDILGAFPDLTLAYHVDRF